MVELKLLVAHTNKILKISKFKDYCPNGLQVEGAAQVNKIVAGVTASQAMIHKAIERKADVLLVHHGYFWRGEDQAITGMKKARIQLLLENNISLLAYHLPLDAHPELGNNVRLADVLGFEVEANLNKEGVGLVGRLSKPMTAFALRDLISERLDRKVLHISADQEDSNKEIKTIAWCTGGAQNYISQAVELGVDAYLSGEISESTVHTARENGIDYFSAGHHATERYGVQALGEHMAEEFNLQYEFVDVWNPV